MTKFDYVAQATLTLSNQFHTDKVNPGAFVTRMRAAISAGDALDECKKSLFYGRDFKIPPPDGAEADTVWREMLSALHPDPKTAEHILHATIGLVTEASEMLEAVYKAMTKNRALDLVNMTEESGDAKWYLAVLAHALGNTWEQDEVINIAKLRARFPNAFTEHDANNRDLATERAILEGESQGKGLNVNRADTTNGDLARERLADAVGMTEEQRDQADRGRKYFKGE